MGYACNGHLRDMLGARGNAREYCHGVLWVSADCKLGFCEGPQDPVVYRGSSRGHPHGMSRDTASVRWVSCGRPRVPMGLPAGARAKAKECALLGGMRYKSAGSDNSY